MLCLWPVSIAKLKDNNKKGDDTLVTPACVERNLDTALNVVTNVTWFSYSCEHTLLESVGGVCGSRHRPRTALCLLLIPGPSRTTVLGVQVGFRTKTMVSVC